MRADSPLPYFGMVALFLLVLRALQSRTRLLSGPAFTGTPRAYRALEGLRGLLASAVFVHHGLITYEFHRTHKVGVPESSFFGHLGYTSVGLFFLLSGFLFWSKARTGRLARWGAFVAGRARRILPAHVFAFSLALLVVFVHSEFTLRESVGALVLKSAQWLTFGMPFFFRLMEQADVNLNGMMAACYGIIWTLHFEWLFYLSLPALVWLTRSRRRALGFVPVLGVVALAAWDVISHPETTGVRRAAGLETCAFAAALMLGFLPGIVSTYVTEHRWVKRLGKGPLADLVALGSLAAFVLFLPPTPGPHYLLLIVPFSLVAAGNDLFGLLSARPTLALGRISYSFYMLHCCVIVGLTNQVARHVPIASLSGLAYWGLMVGAGLAVLVLSLFSYRFVEYPWLVEREHRPAAEPQARPAPHARGGGGLEVRSR